MAYSTPAFHGCQVFFFNLSFMSKDPRLPEQRSSHLTAAHPVLQIHQHHASGYQSLEELHRRQHHFSGYGRKYLSLKHIYEPTRRGVI